jgi:hypothetical protein
MRSRSICLNNISLFILKKIKKLVIIVAKDKKSNWSGKEEGYESFFNFAKAERSNQVLVSFINIIKNN